MKYPTPKAEPKLTIEHVCGLVWVRLDGALVFALPDVKDSRAAAEAYVEDLVKHFREGGR